MFVKLTPKNCWYYLGGLLSYAKYSKLTLTITTIIGG